MDIFKQNIKKWETLPAGKTRCKSSHFEKLNDIQALKLYDSWVSYWENERNWEYNHYEIYLNKTFI